MLFTQPESCTHHCCRGLQHLPLHRHLLGGILVPSCSSSLVLCGVLASPIDSVPGSSVSELCTSTSPVSLWEEASGIPYNPTPAGPPCSLGTASGLVLSGMLPYWLQHSLQQLFWGPLMSPVMGMLKPAAPHQQITGLLWYS